MPGVRRHAYQQPLGGFYPPTQPWLHSAALWQQWTTPTGDWRYAGPTRWPYDGSMMSQVSAGDIAHSGTPYGATDEPSTATQAGDLIGAYAAAADARVKIATLTAEIENAKRMSTTLPYSVVPGKLFYQNEIVKKTAQIAAYKEKLAITMEGEAATVDWRAIGQTGGVVAIGIGVSLIALLAVKTYKETRRNPRGRR